jgi:hypothetical protein
MGFKIIEQTKLKLTLEDRPVLVWVVGGILLFLAALIIIFVPDRELDLRRNLSKKK